MNKIRCDECEHQNTLCGTFDHCCTHPGGYHDYFEVKVIKSCFNCKYQDTTCYNTVGYCEEYDKWEPKESEEEPCITPVDLIGIKYGPDSVRSRNVGESDYALHKIQPWDIWEEYELNPWDADIVKRVLRNKTGESRVQEYNKIIHICEERVRQLTI